MPPQAIPPQRPQGGTPSIVAGDAGDRGDAIGVAHARLAELVDLDSLELAHTPPLETVQGDGCRGAPVKPEGRLGSSVMTPEATVRRL